MLRAIRKTQRNFYLMKINNKHSLILYWGSLAIILLASVYLRLDSINFGLPHSFHADEPEIVELAVKYTYEIRNIINNKDFHRLIPISFVYGMFPTYLLTFVTMIFSKIANILGNSFEKQAIYVLLRTTTALISLGIIPVTVLIYTKITEKKVNKIDIILLTFLTALNWKLIVHSHYVNMDIFLTVLIGITFLLQILYFRNPKKSIFVILGGLTFGFAIGTKITAVLSLPWLIYIFIVKKDYRSLIAFLFLTYIAFSISNPFSIIFAKDFAYRIFEMQSKEAGMVFDSVNSNPLKYLGALIFISTPFVFLLSLYGNLIAFVRSNKNFKTLHIFLTGNILTYLIFFSFNAREVSRWLLPILPLIFVYAVYGIKRIIENETSAILLGLILLATVSMYLYYPSLLPKQFNRHTPKSAAYIWSRDNIPETDNILVITEEGLDPMNKLRNAFVKRPKVYSTENAQFDFPESPVGYKYVILSSKPMKNHKRKEVQEKYPFYTEKWEDFEDTVTDSRQFILIKEFVLPKPNLVNLSDVYIYKNLNPVSDKNYR